MENEEEGEAERMLGGGEEWYVELKERFIRLPE